MESPHELIELMAFNTLSLSDVYDRFSDLPEPIVLHVFSFLDYNDIFRLSSVSRKFRKICLCCPNLLFKLAFDNKKCTANCKKFQRFLKDFLDLHNAQEIHRLGLHWFCHSKAYDCKGSIFLEWLQKALRNKVQELDIAVPVTTDHKPFKFPGGRDQFKSLRVLKLKLQGGKSNLLALELPSLEALSLTCVSVPCKFGEWVSNSCKSLEVLNLEEFSDIYGLNITSSSLKVLTLVSCGGLAPPTSRWLESQVPEDGNFIINCSSLEKLSITKCSFGSFTLYVMNSPSLKALQISDCAIHANFDINISSAQQLQTFTLTMKLTFWIKKGIIPSINLHNSFSARRITLMDGVRYAKSLQLNFQIIEALSQHDQLPEFERLEHLEVTVAELNLDNIAAIASFLVELCRLNTLTLRFKENATQLSEAEIADKICSELLEEHGVESKHLKIITICTTIEKQRVTSFRPYMKDSTARIRAGFSVSY
ncbi:hypothetical protein COLO4_25202 [Corchorus olitorius]|uniref:F-box domain-containing protein n=1 Tax=Corchorus olitorius TaxID=93759 RepID=A0A1R3I4C5_9ROSI|nr:hypothetical protein COLO4_25202 [Corchorus olitorius]